MTSRTEHEYYTETSTGFYCKCCDKTYKTNVYNNKHFSTKKHQDNKKIYKETIFYKRPELLSKDYGVDLYCFVDLVQEKYISKMIMVMKIEMDMIELQEKKDLLKKDGELNTQQHLTLYEKLKNKSVDITEFSKLNDVLVNECSKLHKEDQVIRELLYQIQEKYCKITGGEMTLSNMDTIFRNMSCKSMNKYPRLYKSIIEKYRM